MAPSIQQYLLFGLKYINIGPNVDYVESRIHLSLSFSLSASLCQNLTYREGESEREREREGGRERERVERGRGLTSPQGRFERALAICPFVRSRRPPPLRLPPLWRRTLEVLGAYMREILVPYVGLCTGFR